MTTFSLAAVGVVLGLALFGLVLYFATRPRQLGKRSRSGGIPENFQDGSYQHPSNHD
jgi:hypothetical protein